ncbi:hypothetical protein Tco_0924569 [Tanacetum coccineum]|uniref:Uncharacterized protein n=1 Tax=Tanacetum coccineum TaxID=301880 RepID=A0ABQ5D5N5_9ASTR
MQTQISGGKQTDKQEKSKGKPWGLKGFKALKATKWLSRAAQKGGDDGGDKVVTAVGVAAVEGDGGEGVAMTRWYWCGVVEMTMMMARLEMVAMMGMVVMRGCGDGRQVAGGRRKMGLCRIMEERKCGLGFDLKGYSDSDYDGCNMDRKSTSAMSSAEAGYVAAAGCCANIL